MATRISGPSVPIDFRRGSFNWVRSSRFNRSLRVLASVWACSLAVSSLGAGPITFKTSDSRLAASFEWARGQALAYAFTGDPVGDWYEAALPGRQAFCMRDTAHQSTGAHFLGLDRQTRNMLQKFAENISDSKDWCSYWEITRYNRPATVDYKDSVQFWYNLPANFDVLDACYRMYRWSGDSTYITDPILQNFYKRTVHDYVERWDLSVDRIMARPRIMNIRGHPDPTNRFQTNRGIPSYDEDQPNFTVAIDQLAVEYAGYLAYARIAELQGDQREGNEFVARANAVKKLVNERWWNKNSAAYYSRVNLDHHLEGDGLNSSLLYYGIAGEGQQTMQVLKSILATIEQKQATGIELESYLPEILYRYDQPDAAYQTILDLTREDKARRNYPEVSFAVVSAIVDGLMGIEVETAEAGQALENGAYVEGPIVTTSRLPSQVQWAEIEDVRIGANEIRVRHEGTKKSMLENMSGPSVIWKSCFPGSASQLRVSGKPVPAETIKRHGHVFSCVTIEVGSHESLTVGS